MERREKGFWLFPPSPRPRQLLLQRCCCCCKVLSNFCAHITHRNVRYLQLVREINGIRRRISIRAYYLVASTRQVRTYIRTRVYSRSKKSKLATVAVASSSGVCCTISYKVLHDFAQRPSELAGYLGELFLLRHLDGRYLEIVSQQYILSNVYSPLKLCVFYS